jgi:hypothetical protein
LSEQLIVGAAFLKNSWLYKKADIATAASTAVNSIDFAGRRAVWKFSSNYSILCQACQQVIPFLL